MDKSSDGFRPSVGEDEGHLHVDPVGCDLAVLDDDLLVLDPGAFDVLQRLGGAGDPFSMASWNPFLDDAR